MTTQIRADELVNLLRPEFGNASAGSGGGTSLTEGPGIDIESHAIGLGGDTILVYHANGNPTSEEPFTIAGLIAAVATWANGDIIELPAGVLTGDLTLASSVTIVGRGEYGSPTATINGKITITAGLVKFFSVNHTSSDATASLDVSGASVVELDGGMTTNSGGGRAIRVTGGAVVSRVENWTFYQSAASLVPCCDLNIAAGTDPSLNEWTGSIIIVANSSDYAVKLNAGILLLKDARINNLGAGGHLQRAAGTFFVDNVLYDLGKTNGTITPAPGDKSSWDITTVAAQHASDINAAALLRHNAAPGTVGNVMRDNGTNWISVAAGSYLPFIPTSRGDMIAANATPAWARLALGGAAGSVLTRDANDPTWSAYYLSGTAGQTYTFPAVGGTIPVGTGVVGRVAEWVTNANTLQAANLIAPVANILTLTATAASTLALAITAAKTLTLTATDDYNLTVPATGRAVLWLGALATGAVVADPTGGNARGDYAIDLQVYRSANTQVASGANAVIGGGRDNTGAAPFGFVGGGYQNTASGVGAVVGGGMSNIASGAESTVGGGIYNQALGDYSVACGRRAIIALAHDGSFLFADGTDADCNSVAANEFALRARGGFRHAYDDSNYWTAQVSAAGVTTFATLPVGAGFVFTPPVEITDDLTLAGGDVIAKTATTWNVLNTIATTINFGGACTALNIGAASCVINGAGGITINGGIAANDDITIQGTSHATRASSYVSLQPNGGYVTVGTPSLYGTLTIRCDATNNYAALYTVADIDNGIRIARNKGGGSYNSDWLFYQPATSKDLRLYDTTDRVWFQYGGKVGIGIAPATALHIYSVSDTGLTIDSNVYATYVGFAKASVEKWELVMERDVPVYGMAANDIGFYNDVTGKAHFYIQSATGYAVVASSKTTTGDPAGVEGMLYYNTFDNAIKMYADGAWRTLASW